LLQNRCVVNPQRHIDASWATPSNTEQRAFHRAVGGEPALPACGESALCLHRRTHVSVLRGEVDAITVWLSESGGVHSSAGSPAVAKPRDFSLTVPGRS
jgi:hypothetical protein